MTNSSPSRSRLAGLLYLAGMSSALCGGAQLSTAAPSRGATSLHVVSTPHTVAGAKVIQHKMSPYARAAAAHARDAQNAPGHSATHVQGMGLPRRPHAS